MIPRESFLHNLDTMFALREVVPDPETVLVTASLSGSRLLGLVGIANILV